MADLHGGSLEEALVNATSARNLAKQNGSQADEAAALSTMARIYHSKHLAFVERGQRPYPVALAMAQSHLGEAASIYEGLQNKSELAKMQRELAEVLVSKGDLLDAASAARSAISTASSANDKLCEAKAQQLLADCLARQMAEAEVACKAAQIAVILFNELQDTRGRRSALLSLNAALDSRHGDWKEPLASLRSYFQDVRLPEGEVWSICAALVGDFGPAHTSKREVIKLGDVALAMARDSAGGVANTKQCEVEVLLALAEAHLANGVYIHSLEMADKAAALSKELGDKRGEAKGLECSARVQVVVSEGSPNVSQQALSNAKDAVSLAGEAGDSLLQALAKLTLAELHLRPSGDHELAVNMAEESMPQFSRKDGHGASLVRGLVALARAQAFRKEHQAASKAAMQAAALAGELGEHVMEAKAWQIAAAQALADGNIKDALSSAYVAQKRFKELSDSGNAEEAAKIISSIQESTLSLKGFLPKSRDAHGPYPGMQLAPPVDGPGGRKDRSLTLEVQDADTIVWCTPTIDMPYIKVLLELLALVHHVNQSKSRARIIAVTRGVHNRQCGGLLPSNQSMALSTAVWGVARNQRLDNHRFPIMTMDVSPDFTGEDIARCLPWTETDTAWYRGPAKVN